MSLVYEDIQHALKTHLHISPMKPEAVRVASVDLRLWNEVLYYPRNPHGTLGSTILCDRPQGIIPSPLVRCIPEQGILFYPGDWMLAATHEIVGLGERLEGILSGKSSVARDGISIENAGYVDPGWFGRLTLEVKNLGPLTVRLYPEQYICQIRFNYVADSDYNYRTMPGSHYHMSMGPVTNLHYSPENLMTGKNIGLLDQYGRFISGASVGPADTRHAAAALAPPGLPEYLSRSPAHFPGDSRSDLPTPPDQSEAPEVEIPGE